MSKVKVGWLSDTHIGFQQYGLQRRRDDFAFAAVQTVKDICAAGVSCIIHTGDIIHSNSPRPEDIRGPLREIQKTLLEAQVPMFVIPGNHDYTDPHWLSVVDMESTVKAGMLLMKEGLLQRLECDGIVIEGRRQMAREALLERWPTEPCHILMLHQAVQEFIGYPAVNVLTLADIPTDKAQLIALGDIHINRVISHPNNPKVQVGYPGSTEMNSESEPMKKVWKEIIFQDGELAGIVDHPVKSRLALKVEIDTEEDIAKAIDFAKQEYELVKAAGDMRAPMIFIKYASTIPDVLKRFRTALDPDMYILRPDPVFPKPMPATKPGEITDGEPADPDRVLSPIELLQSTSTMEPELVGVTAQLLNPNLDANGIIDGFIQQRLVAIEQENTGAPGAV